MQISLKNRYAGKLNCPMFHGQRLLGGTRSDEDFDRIVWI